MIYEIEIKVNTGKGDYKTQKLYIESRSEYVLHTIIGDIKKQYKTKEEDYFQQQVNRNLRKLGVNI